MSETEELKKRIEVLEEQVLKALEAQGELNVIMGGRHDFAATRLTMAEEAIERLAGLCKVLT